MMAVLLMHPGVDNARITRGGEAGQTISSLRIAVIAEQSAYEEFCSVRSGEPPTRYETQEQALSAAGTSPMLIVDFSMKKILLHRDGQLEREANFPSDDMLDVSIAVDEIMAP